jgi:hypothetical protein
LKSIPSPVTLSRTFDSFPRFPIRSRKVSSIRFRNANGSLEKRTDNARETAEILAIHALNHLAGDPEALSRFLALAGIGPTTLRQAAADPAFLAGVLDHMLSDEALLTAFAAGQGIRPEAVAEARRALDPRPAVEP